MDSVKVALGSRGMTVEAVRQCTKDRTECMFDFEFKAAIFA